MIITLDGPAGSGKSTTARAVAKRLGYLYLDTGAMYRVVALAFLRADAAPTPEAAARLLPDLRIAVTHADGMMHVALNDEDVTRQIRTQEVGQMASQISTLRAVRETLVAEQRRIGREQDEAVGGVVLDGRDTGTVVFPNADLKIYMMADLEERARRRQEQYAAEGRRISLEQVCAEIEARDQKDRDRDLAPLRKAEDAIVLDTTHRDIDEQVMFVVNHVKARAEEGTSVSASD